MPGVCALTVLLSIALAGCSTGSPTPDEHTSAEPSPERVAADEPMRIYWVDAEGGAATLVVAPSGETLLVDAGWSERRDADRIIRVLEHEVGRKQLDYLVATHYHVDHVGGVPTLASEVPIAQFIDHGPGVEQNRHLENYLAAVGDARRVSVMPGDRFQLGDVEVIILTSAGEVIDSLLPSPVPNPHCESAETRAEMSGEDPQSVGVVARYGEFRFVALGDLTWDLEHRLACPENRVGPIALFQVTQHGSRLSNAPQLVHALAPVVAVMNNGPTKGGSPETFEMLRRAPGLVDLWQVHYAENNGPEHNTDEALIANLTGPDMGHWIKATSRSDGAFTLTNGRTGESRHYTSRRK